MCTNPYPTWDTGRCSNPFPIPLSILGSTRSDLKPVTERHSAEQQVKPFSSFAMKIPSTLVHSSQRPLLYSMPLAEAGYFKGSNRIKPNICIYTQNLIDPCLGSKTLGVYINIYIYIPNTPWDDFQASSLTILADILVCKAEFQMIPGNKSMGPVIYYE